MPTVRAIWSTPTKCVSDPDPPRPAPPSRSNGFQRRDAFAAIDPPLYFGALVGIEVSPEGGMLKCPLPDHDDAFASCQVFRRPNAAGGAAAAHGAGQHL